MHASWMPPRRLICLAVALGTSLSPCCSSKVCPSSHEGLDKLGFGTLASAFDAEGRASGEDVSFLQQQARHRATQLNGVDPSEPRHSSHLADEENLFAARDGEVSSIYPAKYNQVVGICGDIDDGAGTHHCGCYSDSTTIRPSETPAVFKSFAVWRPVPSTTVFSSAHKHHGLEFLFRDAALRGMLPGIAYNPSIIPITEGHAASWHPDARYVAVARHFVGDEECKIRTEQADFQWTGSLYSSVLLLNEKLETLVVGKLPVPIEDYRLFVHKGKVLVTGNIVDREMKDLRQQWSFRVFELLIENVHEGFDDNAQHQCPYSLKVVMQEFKHHGMSDFDYHTSNPRFYGKNIGLFKNKEDGELQLLWRLTNPVTVRNWTGQTSMFTVPGSSALRNNGNPIYLPEYDAYLAVGHMFWTGPEIINDQRYGGTHYLHRIVLFDANPPYKWLRASEPFCFPAVSGLSQDLGPQERNEWCEGIQFIMSWFRKGDDILLTYGVSDCEPALARLPLQALLNITSSDFSAHPPRPVDAHAQAVNVGMWS